MRRMLLALSFVATACGSGSGVPDGGGGNGGAGLEGPEVRLDTDPLGAELSVFPQISGDGPDVYAVWYDRRAGDTDIHFNRSEDGGIHWLAEDVRLDDGPAGSASSYAPRLCSEGRTVHVVWYDRRNGEMDVFYDRSTDGGTTWLPADVRLDTDDAGAAASRHPVVACSGPHVYVAWEDARDGEKDVYFNRSADGGATWLAEDVRLDTDLAGAAASEGPVLCASGERVVVAWSDRRDGAADVRANVSEDGGLTWLLDDMRLDTDAAGAADSTAPRVACAGLTVLAAWEDDRDGAADVRTSRSTDGGHTWLASDVRLDQDEPGAGDSRNPALVLEGSTAFVAWEDARSGAADVYARRSLDAGGTWLDPEVRLDTGGPGTADSFSPDAGADGSHLHVVWSDARNGAFDVYLRSSADAGATWSAPLRLDAGPPGAAHSSFPRVRAEGAEARAVWHDLRDGPGDVYFRRAAPAAAGP